MLDCVSNPNSMESKSESIEKQIEEGTKPHLESVLYNMTLVEAGECGDV